MTLGLVIGGGPAGLMAADQMSAAGMHVIVTEAKPTVARKFLMAGKSGLNLTKSEPFDTFLAGLRRCGAFPAAYAKCVWPQSGVRLGTAIGAGSLYGLFWTRISDRDEGLAIIARMVGAPD